jgi:hypothetical protein
VHLLENPDETHCRRGGWEASPLSSREVGTDLATVARRYLGLALAGTGILAVILAGAYYQQDIATFIRLQGWKSGEAETVVRSFIRAVHRHDASAQNLLDTGSVQPILQKDKLVAVRVPGAGRPVEVPLSRIVPTDSLQALHSSINYRAGTFHVEAQYSDGRWALFGLDRANNELKIVSISAALSNSRPPL